MLLVYHDVKLAPDPAFLQAMLGFLPLARTVHLQPGSVFDNMAARLNLLGKPDYPTTPIIMRLSVREDFYHS